MKPQVKREEAAREYWFEEGCYIIEVASDAEDEQLSIARARVLPGGTTAWHQLTGVTERYLMISGSGRVEVGDELCEQVGPGDVVRIPAGVKQRITNTGKDDLIFYAICSPPFAKECYQNVEKDNSRRFGHE